VQLDQRVTRYQAISVIIVRNSSDYPPIGRREHNPRPLDVFVPLIAVGHDCP